MATCPCFDPEGIRVSGTTIEVNVVSSNGVLHQHCRPDVFAISKAFLMQDNEGFCEFVGYEVFSENFRNDSLSVNAVAAQHLPSLMMWQQASCTQSPIHRAIEEL